MTAETLKGHIEEIATLLIDQIGAGLVGAGNPVIPKTH